VMAERSKRGVKRFAPCQRRPWSHVSRGRLAALEASALLAWRPAYEPWWEHLNLQVPSVDFRNLIRA
jgi:hypothetical protein